jgi:Xaa-Pro aminopeptidase
MYQLVQKSELYTRVENLATYLKQNHLDACLISGLTNLYYYTGTIQNGLLFVTADGDAFFFVRKSFERAQAESGLDNVFQLKGMKNLESELKDKIGFLPETIGFEGDILPVILFEKYKNSLPNCKFKDFSFYLKQIRAVKSDFEINCIKKAGRQIADMFEFMKQHIKVGVSEIELAAISESFVRKAGHQGSIRMRTFNAELFYSVICVGDNANLPTNFDGPSGSKGLYPAAIHPAGTDTVKKGIPVLFDYMGAYMGYLCDNTRIYFVGKPSKELTDAHNKCIEIQNMIAEKLVPGAIPSEIFEETVAYAKSMNFYDNLMGYKSNKVKFFGHGVGLEVDEFPVIAPKFNIPLQEGMVIALEPKKYFKDIGGVGVENTFQVTKEGGKKMINYPDDMIVLEES